MSTHITAPIQLQTAITLANQVMTTLTPFCTKINVAGSVRRSVAEVGDIELVCLPLKHEAAAEDLFGNKGPAEVTVSRDFARTVMALGRVVMGSPGGRQMKIILPQDVQLDLFMPQPEDYFRQLVVRTGPKEFAHRVIANGWRKMGWVGTQDGLRKEKECRNIGTTEHPKWLCIVSKPTLPPSWENEKAFFDWIKVHYIDPQYRY